ncbi:hypothetical protein Tco_0209312 [Tanacetum coccineum]
MSSTRLSLLGDRGDVCLSLVVTLRWNLSVSFIYECEITMELMGEMGNGGCETPCVGEVVVSLMKGFEANFKMVLIDI